MERPSLTIGIEEEYQLVDPHTRELVAYVTQFLSADRQTMDHREFKSELESTHTYLPTRVCYTVAEAHAELQEQRLAVQRMAEEKDLAFIAAGTHPFTSWVTQDVTEFKRFYGRSEDIHRLARKLLIFGMRIHIGIEDREFLIDAMNVLRYLLPHLIALSTSSPFWQGRETGVKSYRNALFQDFPRTGIPTHFTSWDDYTSMLQTLLETNCIADRTKIWWDIRPHPEISALEFRVFDAVPRLDEVIALAGLVQALVAWHWDMRKRNMTFRIYRRDMILENKWRAIRRGIEGPLIDWGKEAEVPMRALAQEILELVDPYLDDLQSREYVVPPIQRILEEGTSAERQLRVYHEEGTLNAVVDLLIEESRVPTS
ncbi:MAG: carboxylate-amine ligase [Chloroflexi bacterium]|nr:carboxylate-amine ligase [Chloroflexota bacterium]